MILIPTYYHWKRTHTTAMSNSETRLGPQARSLMWGSQHPCEVSLSRSREEMLSKSGLIPRSKARSRLSTGFLSEAIYGPHSGPGLVPLDYLK